MPRLASRGVILVYETASEALILKDPEPAREYEAGNDWWQNLGNSVSSTPNIADVEAIWRRFESQGIVSPGQSLDFTKAWISRFDIAPENQLYVTGQARGKTIALLPLKRVRRFGVDVLTWFAGSHVGCNAPLIDREMFAKLSVLERINVWQQMQRGLFGADLVYLHGVPVFEGEDYFAQLGRFVSQDYLYRAVFDNWQECAAKQHTRSRRKHDRQQGAKLAAMGKVEFVELSGKDAGLDQALETMFKQKAARFKQWGVENPFAEQKVREFYGDLIKGDNELKGKLHVLRLDGQIIAVRYNLAHQKTMFSLISSMSEREELKPGSPGKQNVFNSIKHAFNANYTAYDMGAGYSDEKRHWCNKIIPLRTHYVPLSAKGESVTRLHRTKSLAQKAIKDNDRLFSWFKYVRGFVFRGL
ncbi:hypothetical protein MNBD_ALPHA12-1225 [hydrothermal vent metagenome]|uniref:BioF2-like acetyltransferase domain-containing protein n=1 Tax=hydrothermal vent metagenome TaxID=652676 RepID=A0A3B0U0L2_9ZZZZ